MNGHLKNEETKNSRKNNKEENMRKIVKYKLELGEKKDKYLKKRI